MSLCTTDGAVVASKEVEAAFRWSCKAPPSANLMLYNWNVIVLCFPVIKSTNHMSTGFVKDDELSNNISTEKQYDVTTPLLCDIKM